MRGGEGINSGSITATYGPFTVKAGGRYLLSAAASSFGTSVELQMLGADGATYQPVPNIALSSANMKLTAAGTVTGDIPPGRYQFVLVGSFTACFVSLTRVPVE